MKTYTSILEKRVEENKHKTGAANKKYPHLKWVMRKGQDLVSDVVPVYTEDGWAPGRWTCLFFDNEPVGLEIYEIYDKKVFDSKKECQAAISKQYQI